MLARMVRFKFEEMFYSFVVVSILILLLSIFVLLQEISIALANPWHALGLLFIEFVKRDEFLQRTYIDQLNRKKASTTSKKSPISND